MLQSHRYANGLFSSLRLLQLLHRHNRIPSGNSTLKQDPSLLTSLAICQLKCLTTTCNLKTGGHPLHARQPPIGRAPLLLPAVGHAVRGLMRGQGRLRKTRAVRYASKGGTEMQSPGLQSREPAVYTGLLTTRQMTAVHQHGDEQC